MAITGPDKNDPSKKQAKISDGVTGGEPAKGLTPVDKKTDLRYTKKQISSKTALRAQKAKEAVYNVMVGDVHLLTNKSISASEILNKCEYTQKMILLETEIKKIQEEITAAEAASVQDTAYIASLKQELESRQTTYNDNQAAKVEEVMGNYVQLIGDQAKANTRNMKELSTDFTMKELTAIDKARDELYKFLTSPKNTAVDFKVRGQGLAKVDKSLESASRMKNVIQLSVWLKRGGHEPSFRLLQFRDELNHLLQNKERLVDIIQESRRQVVEGPDSPRKKAKKVDEYDALLKLVDDIKAFRERMNQSAEIKALQAKHASIVSRAFGDAGVQTPELPTQSSSPKEKSRKGFFASSKGSSKTTTQHVATSAVGDSPYQAAVNDYVAVIQKISVSLIALSQDKIIESKDIPSGLTSSASQLKQTSAALFDTSAGSEALKEQHLKLLEQQQEIVQQLSERIIYLKVDEDDKKFVSRFEKAAPQYKELTDNIVKATDILQNQMLRIKTAEEEAAKKEARPGK